MYLDLSKRPITWNRVTFRANLVELQLILILILKKKKEYQLMCPGEKILLEMYSTVILFSRYI